MSREDKTDETKGVPKKDNKNEKFKDSPKKGKSVENKDSPKKDKSNEDNEFQFIKVETKNKEGKTNSSPVTQPTGLSNKEFPNVTNSPKKTRKYSSPTEMFSHVQLYATLIPGMNPTRTSYPTIAYKTSRITTSNAKQRTITAKHALKTPTVKANMYTTHDPTSMFEAMESMVVFPTKHTSPNLRDRLKLGMPTIIYTPSFKKRQTTVSVIKPTKPITPVNIAVHKEIQSEEMQITEQPTKSTNNKVKNEDDTSEPVRKPNKSINKKVEDEDDNPKVASNLSKSINKKVEDEDDNPKVASKTSKSINKKVEDEDDNPKVASKSINKKIQNDEHTSKAENKTGKSINKKIDDAEDSTTQVPYQFNKNLQRDKDIFSQFPKKPTTAAKGEPTRKTTKPLDPRITGKSADSDFGAKSPSSNKSKTVKENQTKIETNHTQKDFLKNTKELLQNSKELLQNSKEILENTRKPLANSKELLENSKEILENSKEPFGNSSTIYPTHNDPDMVAPLMPISSMDGGAPFELTLSADPQANAAHIALIPKNTDATAYGGVSLPPNESHELLNPYEESMKHVGETGNYAYHQAGAGDLGDIQDEERPPSPKLQPSDEIYGRRDIPAVKPIVEEGLVTIPLTTNEYEANAEVRSWESHEKAMKEKHDFEKQYKIFEGLDADPSMPHLKLNEENARTRSWAEHEFQMQTKQIQQQYEDFAKVDQSNASTEFAKQYNEFEKMRNETLANISKNMENENESKPIEFPSATKLKEDKGKVNNQGRKLNPNSFKQNESDDEYANYVNQVDGYINRKENDNNVQQTQTKNTTLPAEPSKLIVQNADINKPNSEEKVNTTSSHSSPDQPANNNNNNNIPANVTTSLEANNTNTERVLNISSSIGQEVNITNFTTSAAMDKSVPVNTRVLIKVSDGHPSMFTNAPLGESVSNATSVDKNAGKEIGIKKADATIMVTARRRHEYERPDRNFKPLTIDDIINNDVGNDGTPRANVKILSNTPRYSDEMMSNIYLMNESLHNKLDDEFNDYNHLKEFRKSLRQGYEPQKLVDTYFPMEIHDSQYGKKMTNNTNGDESVKKDDKYTLYKRLQGKLKVDETTSPSSIYVDNRVFIYGGPKDKNDMISGNPHAFITLPKELSKTGSSKSDIEDNGVNNLSGSNKVIVLTKQPFDKAVNNKEEEIKSDVLPTLTSNVMKSNKIDDNNVMQENIANKEIKGLDALSGPDETFNYGKQKLPSEEKSNSIVTPGSQRNPERKGKPKFTSIPNPYNFLVPETKKFSNDVQHGATILKNIEVEPKSRYFVAGKENIVNNEDLSKVKSPILNIVSDNKISNLKAEIFSSHSHGVHDKNINNYGTVSNGNVNTTDEKLNREKTKANPVSSGNNTNTNTNNTKNSTQDVTLKLLEEVTQKPAVQEDLYKKEEHLSPRQRHPTNQPTRKKQTTDRSETTPIIVYLSQDKNKDTNEKPPDIAHLKSIIQKQKTSPRILPTTSPKSKQMEKSEKLEKLPTEAEKPIKKMIKPEVKLPLSTPEETSSLLRANYLAHVTNDENELFNIPIAEKAEVTGTKKNKYTSPINQENLPGAEDSANVQEIPEMFDLQNIHTPLQPVSHNMQDLITQTQASMGNLPGFNESNQEQNDTSTKSPNNESFVRETIQQPTNINKEEEIKKEFNAEKLPFVEKRFRIAKEFVKNDFVGSKKGNESIKRGVRRRSRNKERYLMKTKNISKNSFKNIFSKNKKFGIDNIRVRNKNTKNDNRKSHQTVLIRKTRDIDNDYSTSINLHTDTDNAKRYTIRNTHNKRQVIPFDRAYYINNLLSLTAHDYINDIPDDMPYKYSPLKHSGIRKHHMKRREVAILNIPYIFDRIPHNIKRREDEADDLMLFHYQNSIAKRSDIKNSPLSRKVHKKTVSNKKKEMQDNVAIFPSVINAQLLQDVVDANRNSDINQLRNFHVTNSASIISMPELHILNLINRSLNTVYNIRNSQLGPTRTNDVSQYPITKKQIIKIIQSVEKLQSEKKTNKSMLDFSKISDMALSTFHKFLARHNYSTSSIQEESFPEPKYEYNRHTNIANERSRKNISERLQLFGGSRSRTFRQMVLKGITNIQNKSHLKRSEIKATKKNNVQKVVISRKHGIKTNITNGNTPVGKRELIPSRVGVLQPSNLKPMPPVGHDPDEEPFQAVEVGFELPAKLKHSKSSSNNETEENDMTLQYNDQSNSSQYTEKSASKLNSSKSSQYDEQPDSNFNSSTNLQHDQGPDSISNSSATLNSDKKLNSSKSSQYDESPDSKYNSSSQYNERPNLKMNSSIRLEHDERLPSSINSSTTSLHDEGLVSKFNSSDYSQHEEGLNSKMNSSLSPIYNERSDSKLNSSLQNDGRPNSKLNSTSLQSDQPFESYINSSKVGSMGKNQQNETKIAKDGKENKQSENEQQQEEKEYPPVGPDGKPHADSGPQEHKIIEAQAHQDNYNESAPDVGESGKNEVGSNHVTAVAKKLSPNKPNDDKGDAVMDTTFEAGLKEEERKAATNKYGENKKVTSITAESDKPGGNVKNESDKNVATVNSDNDKAIAANNSDKTEASQKVAPLGKTEEAISGNNIYHQTHQIFSIGNQNQTHPANMLISSEASFGNKVNFTKLQIDIKPIAKASSNETSTGNEGETRETKEMKEIKDNLEALVKQQNTNVKYPHLKLPTKNGDYIGPMDIFDDLGGSQPTKSQHKLGEVKKEHEDEVQAGPAQQWQAKSWVVVRPGRFPGFG